MNCQIYAQNKQCANCKYFIPHKNNKIVSLGLCRMFGNKVNSNNDNIKKSEKIIYNFAQHCRDDENLCGKNASLYEEGVITITRTVKNNDANNTNDENKLSIMDDEMKKLLNDYYKFLRNEPDW